jgi:hypothetical protein
MRVGLSPRAWRAGYAGYVEPRVTRTAFPAGVNRSPGSRTGSA